MSVLLIDTFTRIRNGQMANRTTITARYSKFIVSVLTVMTEQGYIRGFEVMDQDALPYIEIYLSYYNGEPVINMIKAISKPGRRVYSAIADLKRSHNGLGTKILSTPKGVMVDADARKQRVGGEVLCEIF